MRHRSIILAAVITVLAVHFTVAQVRLTGMVTDVVDGKTVILESKMGKVTAVLQFIDVPEPEQPLHQTVVDHLGVLAKGKTAEFHLLSIGQGRMTGRLVINGIDVSQQMLRDGAAWLLPIEQSGQQRNQFADYDESEKLAKADKLGVWSIAGLKAAWVVRAEKEEAQRQKDLANKPLRATRGAVSQFQTISRPGVISDGKLAAFDRDAWLDVFAESGTESHGIKVYTDPNQRFRVFYTSHAFVTLGSGEKKQRLECRVMYVKYQLVNGSEAAMYLIGFRALSDDYNFSRKRSRMTATVDKLAIPFGSPYGFRGLTFYGAEEIMFYRASKATLRKISNAGSVQIRIDNATGPMGKDLQALTKQLVDGT